MSAERWRDEARMSPAGYAFVSATETPPKVVYRCEFCNERVVAVDRHNDTCKLRASAATHEGVEK